LNKSKLGGRLPFIVLGHSSFSAFYGTRRRVTNGGSVLERGVGHLMFSLILINQ
jgi:hypothetical protein